VLTELSVPLYTLRRFHVTSLPLVKQFRQTKQNSLKGQVKAIINGQLAYCDEIFQVLCFHADGPGLRILEPKTINLDGIRNGIHGIQIEKENWCHGVHSPRNMLPTGQFP